MKLFSSFHRLIFTSCLLITILAPGLLFSSHAADQDPLVVFLVRHAEKLDSSSDSDLSPAGYLRAAALAHVLRGANIKHVHSTNFKRTQKTAEPVALRLSLTVMLYDPANLHELVAQLRGVNGRHLIVGHSKTTPKMVELLGGEPGPPIKETSEFDRLYIVSTSSDGAVGTVVMRYGAPQTEK